jgi:hypothetical protein
MAELERAATDADEAAVRLIADERSVNIHNPLNCEHLEHLRNKSSKR